MATDPADDPVLTACKYNLSRFRIKELKDVLHQLGLPKQGKKQELVDRVIAVLFGEQEQVSKTTGLPQTKIVERETVVKIVEDTFRKMQDPAGTVAASRSHTESGHSAKPKKKPDDSAQLNVKVRCPCGNSMPNDSMIKCIDPQCNIWQHVSCVIIPENEKPADSSVSSELPSCFYCEMCRISRADPFWVTINHLLLPRLIGPPKIAADGSFTVQYTAKSFPLSRTNREMLQKAEYDLQIQNSGDDTSEIDVKPDGSWRVKGRTELKDLTQWHLPDGTLSVATDTATKPDMCIVKDEVKEEPLSEEPGCHLKLGIRKNRNGHWEINRKGDTGFVPSSDNDHARHLENRKRINLTSSIEDVDTEDDSPDLDPGLSDYPMIHVNDLDSSPTDDNVPPASTEQDIIVLSDSDDDTVTVLSPSAVNCNSALDTKNPFPPKPETSGVCEPSGCPNETTFPELNEGFSDIGLPFWECPQDDPSYQIFDPCTRVTDDPDEVQNCPANYKSKHEPVSGGNVGLIAATANLLDDQEGALQPCTTTERDGAIGLANLCDHTQARHDGNWTSNGADESSISAKNAAQKRRNSGDEITALDGTVDGSRNGDDQTGKRCDPFSPPQKRRSVRSRVILSIDSDSDEHA